MAGERLALLVAEHESLGVKERAYFMFSSLAESHAHLDYSQQAYDM
jgi:hypothetical protein